jgi:hypothetical protein
MLKPSLKEGFLFTFYKSSHPTSKSGMKYILYLAVFCLWGLSSSAQEKGSAKLYGYRQGVLPGVSNKHNISELPVPRPDERLVKPMKPKFNYLLYLVSSKNITPEEVWINGIPHRIQTHPVDSSPVVLVNYNLPMRPRKTELVPKTRHNIVQLVPGDVMDNPANTKLKALADSNELVVVYTCRKKTYYVALKKFAALEPIAAM